jgi:hypothetical protein
LFNFFGSQKNRKVGAERKIIKKASPNRFWDIQVEINKIKLPQTIKTVLTKYKYGCIKFKLLCADDK